MKWNWLNYIQFWSEKGTIQSLDMIAAFRLMTTKLLTYFQYFAFQDCMMSPVQALGPHVVDR